MNTAIVVALIAALVSGVSGYYISFRFHSSDYAATDRSGDFGAPRGGFFALLSGALIGMLLFPLGSRLLPLPPDAVGVGMITAMVVGAAAGFAGALRGQAYRARQRDE